MIFVSTWSYTPENRAAIEARFQETGGGPPEGVKMLGRWHAVGQGKGVVVAEADDPAAIATWFHDWSDLMSFDTYPALDDEAVAKVIS